MKQRKDFDAVKSRVYNCIGTGAENAVSRYELTALTGYHDRLVRAAIESLRKKHSIIEHHNGSGYYKPSRTAQGAVEAAEWIRRQNNRARAIKASTKGSERFIKSMQNMIPGQMEMFGGGNG